MYPPSSISVTQDCVQVIADGINRENYATRTAPIEYLCFGYVKIRSNRRSTHSATTSADVGGQTLGSLEKITS